MALITHATLAYVEARQASTNSHHDYGPRLNAAIWSLTGLAAVFLSLRVYCKRLRQNKLWWDDYILIAAFIALLTQSSMLSICVHFGLGKHSSEITDWSSYLYFLNITAVCSIIAAAWSKTSFAVTLLRLSTSRMSHLVWFIITSVNIFLGLSCIYTFIRCSPVRKVWEGTSVAGVCWSKEVTITYNSFSSCWSGAMDIVLAILPWVLINRLTLNKKERIGVLVGMSIGSLAGITSIAKAVTLSGIKDPDTIVTVSIMILATAETVITIVAASIPVLRVFVRDTLQSPSSQDTSQEPRISYTSSRFEFLSLPSPVQMNSFKESEFDYRLSGQFSREME